MSMNTELLEHDKAKILIVDDNEGVRNVLKNFLKYCGYKVVEAEDGVSALVVFNQANPNFVICDLHIPELNGIGLLYAIKRIKPNMPVIVISGMGTCEDIIEILRLGACDYFKKPFSSLEKIGISIIKHLNTARLLEEGRKNQKRLEEAVHRRTEELLKRTTDTEIANEALKRELMSHARMVKEMEKMHDGIINCIVRITEKRDPYTAGHQHRVSKIAVALAQRLMLDQKMIEGIRIAGLLHDVGKISIPTEILNRPGTLKESEMRLIKDHPEDGFNILQGIEFPWPIAEITYQHHEKVDGSGYPRGLSGDDILLEARILSLADVIEAIASHRPYRPALGLDRAMHEVLIQKGKAFDPELADHCLELFASGNFSIDDLG